MLLDDLLNHGLTRREFIQRGIALGIGGGLHSSLLQRIERGGFALDSHAVEMLPSTSPLIGHEKTLLQIALPPMGIRRSARESSAGRNGLTPAARQRFIAAVKEMKEKTNQQLGDSYDYDKYVEWHQEAGSSHQIHGSPLFLPWHRYFLRRFEQDLQQADLRLGNDGRVTLPYWDWTQDSSRDPIAPNGSIWKADFMGRGGTSSPWIVPDGPFATNIPAGNWPLATGGQLARSVGQAFAGQALPTLAEAQQAVGESGGRITLYDSSPWDDTVDATLSFRNLLEGFVRVPSAPGEGIHNQSHVWVGGQMGNVLVSPEDPVFFLHHCNIDRLWAKWQYYNPSAVQYPPAGTLPAGLNINEPMWPWDSLQVGADPNSPDTTPGDVLSHRALGYDYDRRALPRVGRI